MVICEVEKNMKERIRVSIERYRGSTFCDIRVYFEAENGEWRPTRKGISLGKGSIDGVMEGLKTAREKLGA